MAANMKVAVDLMPPELRARENAHQRASGWVTIVIAVVVALLLVTFALHLQIRRNHAAIEPLRARVAEMQATQPKAIATLAQIQALTKTLMGTKALLQEPDWNALVNDVATAAMPTMWVAQCDMRQPLSSTSTDVAKLTVLGSAATEQDVASFISRLSTSPRLSDIRVQVGLTPTATPQDAVEFTVTARIVGPAEVAP